MKKLRVQHRYSKEQYKRQTVKGACFVLACLFIIGLMLSLAGCDQAAETEYGIDVTVPTQSAVTDETTGDTLTTDETHTDRPGQDDDRVTEPDESNSGTDNETDTTDNNNTTDIDDGNEIGEALQVRPDLPSGALRLWWPLSGMTNPLLVDSRSAQAVFSLVFDSLYKIDEDQNLIPMLADNLSDPTDALELTLQIRQDLVFHDGQTLTAADVGATMQFILEHADRSPYASGLSAVDTVTWSDEAPYTLQINMRSADPWIGYALTFPILPQQALTENLSSDALLAGTGRYAMESWEDENLLLALHKPSADIAELRHIRVRFYADKRAALSGFAADEIDLIALDADTYQSFRPRTNLRFHLFAGSRQVFLSYQTATGALLADEQRFLTMKRLMYQTFYQNVNHVLGQQTILPLTLNNEFIDIQKFDPVSVLQAFEPADWEPTSTPVRIIWPESDAARGLLADEISQMLQTAGISWEAEAISDADFAETVRAGQYDLALLEAVLPAQPDPSWLYLALFDRQLDRHQLRSTSEAQSDESANKPASGTAFSDYQTWQSHLRTIWHEKAPQRLLPADEMDLLMTHTAARAPWDGLVIRTEALLYGDRIVGRSTPNRYQIYEGIEALWVWSTQS